MLEVLPRELPGDLRGRAVQGPGQNYQGVGPRCCPMGKKATLTAELLNFGTVDVWGQKFFVVGTVLCTVGYLVAFLVSTHYMPGYVPLPVWTTKNVS